MSWFHKGLEDSGEPASTGQKRLVRVWGRKLAFVLTEEEFFFIELSGFEKWIDTLTKMEAISILNRASSHAKEIQSRAKRIEPQVEDSFDDDTDPVLDPDDDPAFF